MVVGVVEDPPPIAITVTRKVATEAAAAEASGVNSHPQRCRSDMRGVVLTGCRCGCGVAERMRGREDSWKCWNDS